MTFMICHEVIYGQLFSTTVDRAINFIEIYGSHASCTETFDLINELEHSDFDHCTKKWTRDSALSKLIFFDEPTL